MDIKQFRDALVDVGIPCSYPKKTEDAVDGVAITLDYKKRMNGSYQSDWDAVMVDYDTDIIIALGGTTPHNAKQIKKVSLKEIDSDDKPVLFIQNTRNPQAVGHDLGLFYDSYLNQRKILLIKELSQNILDTLGLKHLQNEYSLHFFGKDITKSKHDAKEAANIIRTHLDEGLYQHCLKQI